MGYDYETIIIGGGIAGLQTAIQLGRCLRKVLVIDDGEGRSVIARNYRNILGYPDGVSGQQLRKQGELQATSFGVRFVRERVLEIKMKKEHQFVVTDSRSSSYTAKTIVLATGITDPIPVIAGLAPCLGESIFICPDCDGYETRNKRTVLIGSSKELVSMAEAVSMYTEKLILVNHHEPTNEVQNYLPPYLQAKYEIYNASIREIIHQQGNLEEIILATGRKISCERGFLAFAGAKVNSTLLQNFPLSFSDQGHVVVDPRSQATSFPGIWAVGDIVTHAQQVTCAMADGAKAAIWIHKYLRKQDEIEQKRAFATSKV